MSNGGYVTSHIVLVDKIANKQISMEGGMTRLCRYRHNLVNAECLIMLSSLSIKHCNHEKYRVYFNLLGIIKENLETLKADHLVYSVYIVGWVKWF